MFTAWIRRVKPEYAWLEFNSKSRSVKLSDPDQDKVQRPADRLADTGIEVRGK